MSLDAHKRKVLSDLSRLPLGEISKVAIREVVAAGADKSSKKEEAAPAKKEEAKKEEPAEKKDK